MFYAGQKVTAGEMNAELFTADFRAGQKVRKSQVAGLPDPEHWVRAYLLNKGLSPGDPGSGVRVTGTRLWMRHDTPDPSMPTLPFRGPSASGVTSAAAMLPEAGPVENEGGWGISVGSSTSSRHVCIRKSVSPPLTQGGLFGGYVSRNVQLRQSNSSVNAFYEEYIYVTVGSTAQVRGVLLEANTDDIEISAIRDWEERLERFQLNPLSVQEGDRIVIEHSVHLVNPNAGSSGGVYMWVDGPDGAFYDFSHLDGLAVVPWAGDPPKLNAGLNATVTVGSAFTRTAREII